MKVAIMQPYFFPYLGYWQLIVNTDEFVFFDVVQYNKKSWMNRNRILHPDKSKEFQYISLPIIKPSKGALLSEIVINNNDAWKEKIFVQMSVYKKLKAPFYNDVIELLHKIFSDESDKFTDVILNSVKQVCQYLDIEFKYRFASEIDFDRKPIQGPGDWALQISKKICASEYINPPGGYEIFGENKYRQHCIELKFLKSNLSVYKQSWRKEFQEALSLLDVLMFNDKETVKELLKNDFILLTKQELEIPRR